MSSYEFRLDREGDCLIASFNGDISTHRYSELRNDYNEIHRVLSEMEPRNIIFELAGTTFFGSLFVGLVIRISVHAWKGGGQVAVCGLSEQLRGLLQKLILLDDNLNQSDRIFHCGSRREALDLICEGTMNA